jgi:hypothetical protein
MATTTLDRIALPEPVFVPDMSAQPLATIASVLVSDDGGLTGDTEVPGIQPITVVSAGGARHYEVRSGSFAGRFVHGSPLNPVPRHGGYYRLLRIEDNGYQELGALVQYHSSGSEHRHNPENGWNIIAGPEGPWPLPNDSLAKVDIDNGWVSVEVEAPAEPDGRPSAPAGHDYIDNDGANHTCGLAEVEGNGRALLNPAVEPGRAYIGWHTWQHESFAGTAVADNNGGFIFYASTQLVRPTGDDVTRTATTRRAPMKPGELNWVRAAVLEPARIDNVDALTDLRATLVRMQTAFTDLNYELNDIADEAEWCDEYERIIEAEGMVPREKRVVDWEIKVEVKLSFVLDSPGSEVDEGIQSETGLEDFEASEVRVTGKCEVTFTRSAKSEEEAREQIDRDEVRSKVYDDMSAGYNNFDIDDWEIQSVEECA